MQCCNLDYCLLILLLPSPDNSSYTVFSLLYSSHNLRLIIQGLGHPYRNTASVQANVADIVSRQGSFIEGDLTLSVKKLVGEVCTMIRHKSITKNSASRGDTPIPTPTVQSSKNIQPLHTNPVDFIPARLKYGQSKSTPGSSTGLGTPLGIALGGGSGVGVGVEAEVKELDPSLSPDSTLTSSVSLFAPAPAPPKMSSPGRFLREDQSV